MKGVGTGIIRQVRLMDEDAAGDHTPGEIEFLVDGGSTNHCVNRSDVVIDHTGQQRKLVGVSSGCDVEVVHLKELFLSSKSLQVPCLR